MSKLIFQEYNVEVSKGISQSIEESIYFNRCTLMVDELKRKIVDKCKLCLSF